MVKRYIKYLLALPALVLILSLNACSDDEISDSINRQESQAVGLEEVELPAPLGINIRMGEGTRDDEESSQDKKESDLEIEAAAPNETALAPTQENENYHFAIFFKSDNTLAFIASLKTTEFREVDPDGDTDINKGLNLAIKKVYKSDNDPFNLVYNKDESDSEISVNDRINKFKNYLSDLTGYFLINFDRSLVANAEDNSASNNMEFLKANIVKKSDDAGESYISDLDNLLSLEYKDYKISAKNSSGKNADFFTMTSAIYMDKSTEKIIPATIIEPGNIYYTEDNAFNGDPAIKAYVERLAVKYRLNVSKDSNNEVTKAEGFVGTVKMFEKVVANNGEFEIQTSPYNWHAQFIGFTVNATEPTEYLVKNLKNEDYFTTWNYPDSYLSYWAEDPHYSVKSKSTVDNFLSITPVDNNSKEGYPHQYRDALETDSIRSYVNYENPEHPYLNYVTFNSITNKNAEFYSLENTFVDVSSASNNEKYNKQMWDGVGQFNYYNANTHFLLACRLIIGDNNLQRDVFRDEDDVFYAEKPHLLTAKLTLLNERNLTGGSADIRVLNVDWMDTGGDHKADLRIMTWPKGARLYYKPNGGTMRAATIADLDVIPAQLTGGDGKVLIAPSPDNIKEGGQYYLKSVTEEKLISYNELISLFHKFSGAIDLYKNGMMYYAAPITHNKTELKEDSWETVGDIGVLRNNLYEVTVKGVKAPGHSVADAFDPIIPMFDTDRDYLSARVRVLRWHNVTTAVTPIPSE